MRRDPEPGPAVDPALPNAPSGRRLARLAFVLSLTPGTVITMVLAPALRSPALLATGLALLGLALLARHRLAALVLARHAGARDPEPDAARGPPLETPR